MWIVILRSAVGNPEDGYDIASTSDLRKFSHKSEAIGHGFTLGNDDDFNVGFIRNGRLESLWWMDHRINEDQATLDETGREIGLSR